MLKKVVFLFLLGVVAGCSPDSPPPEPPETQPPEKIDETEIPGVISEEREAVAAGSGLPQPKTESTLLNCQEMDGMSVYCGYQNPEDLVLIPDGTALIVSEMGEFMLDTPGGLSLLDLESGKRAEITIDWSADSSWGDGKCERPDSEAFSPHGIDLITRTDGVHQLLVVNHGQREAVEFFELLETEEQWSLTWRGCAIPPGDPFINDVAALEDGGFFVTHMWDKSTPFEKIVEQFMNGEKMGWVWEWQRDSGFTKLEASAGLMPNGIAVNADNTKVFINLYLGNETIRIDRDSGEVDGSFEVQQPDNVTVDVDGNLWIASHKHDPLGQTCAAVTEGPCLLPYEVIKVDPDAFEPEVVLQQDGPPMGYGTVALRVDDRIYTGSAHGDRVASRTISQ